MKLLNEHLFASRKDYEKHELNETDVQKNPFHQFEIWFKDALAAEIEEPSAMTLATVGNNGKPSARIVLLRQVQEEKGFTFFTNYLSRKGREILENPNAALLFYWDDLERQIRIEGKIQKISADESDSYFLSRPRLSQIGAVASPQSQKIENRKVLEQKVAELEHLEVIQRPEHWGGYILSPDYFEFWQGRPNRLHDRICYELEGNVWTISRLAP